MRRLDTWLLERVYEPLACEIESWTGVKTWQVAFVCAGIWLCCDVAYFSIRLGLGFCGWFVIAFMLVCGFATASLILTTAFLSSGRMGNPWKHQPFITFGRKLNLVLTIYDFTGAAATTYLGLEYLPVGTVGSIMLTSVWYLISCDRRPPKERHVPAPWEVVTKLLPLPQGGAA
jgi:hypothetical protein